MQTISEKEVLLERAMKLGIVAVDPMNLESLKLACDLTEARTWHPERSRGTAKESG